jgi:hypothetical protein
MSRPTQPPWFKHPINIRWRIHHYAIHENSYLHIYLIF